MSSANCEVQSGHGGARLMAFDAPISIETMQCMLIIADLFKRSCLVGVRYLRASLVGFA